MEEKSKWQILKELWSNKRYRAFIILGFYFVFFLFLTISIRGIKSLETPMDYEEKIESYEYQYVITKEENSYLIKGEHYGTKDLIHDLSDSSIYVIEEEQFYKVIENKMIPSSDKIYGLHLLKLQSRNIETLLTKCNLTYTKEYQENVVLKNYEITIKDFYQWYDGAFSNNNELIFITVEETNHIRTKISFDLTNFDQTIRTITYFNQNQLTNLEINYEKG